MAFIPFWNWSGKEFDMQAWMQKVALSKKCSRAVWLNGRVVEMVVRF